MQVGFAIPSASTLASRLILLVGLENKIVEVDINANIVIRTIAIVPVGMYRVGMRFNVILLPLFILNFMCRIVSILLGREVQSGWRSIS